MANKWIHEAKHLQTGRDALYNKQHAHDDCFELLWVREGSGSLLAGNALYRLEPWHIYLIPALMLHYTIPSDGENYVRSKLVCCTEPVKQLLGMCGAETISNVIEHEFRNIGIEDEKIKQQLDRCFREAAQLNENVTEKSAVMTVSLILGVLSSVIDTDNTVSDADTRTDWLINKALEYINSHLREQQELSVIAEYCHVSKYHLCHRFREATGMTVMQYISGQRLLMAMAELIETDRPISEIAMENGYCSFSHFCSAFKKSEGISPAVFRALKKRKIN